MELRRKVVDLERENQELKEEIETLNGNIEEWKKKALGLYEEYQLLCDKIVTQGIYFDHRKGVHSIDDTVSS